MPSGTKLATALISLTSVALLFKYFSPPSSIIAWSLQTRQRKKTLLGTEKVRSTRDSLGRYRTRTFKEVTELLFGDFQTFTKT